MDKRMKFEERSLKDETKRDLLGMVVEGGYHAR